MRKQYTRVQYNENGLKQCTNCQEYKETPDFHKYSKAQDGLKPWCKVCVKNYDIVENDPKRIFPRKLDEHGNIHCRNCGGYFKEEDMKVPPNSKYKGLSYCAECAPLLSRTRTLQKYNLTLEDYHNLLQSQDFSCKICKQKDTTFRKRLSVDHDHGCCPGEGSCGKCIRGLLCHHCNAALGNAKDSIETLQRMIDYLKK
jgi:hypothetical protein